MRQISRQSIHCLCNVKIIKLYELHKTCGKEITMDNILTIDKIEKYYGSKSSLTKAIDGISFEVEKGEFVAIMGHQAQEKQLCLIVSQQLIK